MIFNGTPTGTLFGLVIATTCFYFSAGMFARMNSTRIVFLVVLFASICFSIVAGLFYLGGVFEIIDIPKNQEPARELRKIATRTAIAIWMFIYLRNAEVVAAFKNREREPANEKWNST